MISYKKTKHLIVVPLRLESQRLPKKILAPIGDSTLSQRVLESVLKATQKHDDVSVIAAVDHEETRAHLIKHFGDRIDILMTRPDLRSGSDRVYAAYKKLTAKKQIGLHQIKSLTNVQGDMPFLDPLAIQKILSKIKSGKSPLECMWTLAQTWPKDLEATGLDHVKVLCDKHDRAIYFSRFPIPCSRELKSSELLLHVGIYAYTPLALESFCKSKSPPMELLEKLEQLRALHLGIPIHVSKHQPRQGYSFEGVDTSVDLERARELSQQKRKR